MSDNAPSSRRTSLSLDDFVDGVVAGNRTTLSRAITLIESANPKHQHQSQQLLQRLIPETGKSIRLGISGVPGVGKSTFIETLGSYLTDQGHKVAVLAIDPSSSRTGGSILGDKTRMTRLSVNPAAYVRPSPTSGTLGGVNRVTRESILVCEAAGFDVVLVESVGVGQSETTLASMVDCFLLLMLPGAGDELQGIKKGVLEVADIIAVNKADPDNQLAAQQAANAYQRALHIMSPANPSWTVPVVTCSALHESRIDEIWQQVLAFKACTEKDNSWQQKREQQQADWMWALVEHQVLDRLKSDSALGELSRSFEQAVRHGETTAVSAASELFSAFVEQLKR